MIGPMVFALAHSPFLGPVSWAGVGEALARLNQPAVVLDLRGALEAADRFYEAFGRVAAEQINAPSILVAHSGAGALVPAIARSAGGLVRAAIFVDALLSHPDKRWIDTAPSSLVARIRAGAQGGRAPPWPTLLTPADLARLIPDAGMREELISSAPAAPMAFLEEPAPSYGAWAPPAGCAYLQLSSTYDTEAGEARALGWPVERLSSHHLGAMAEPDLIAQAILRLAGRLNA